jgi:SPP1 family phage portal protein
MLTPEKLKKIIEGDGARQTKVANQLAYVHGENPSILKPEAKEEPDNRIPVPFARRAVNMTAGYLGKEGNITYQGDGYDDDLKDVFTANDEGLITSELLRAACQHGEAFELHYTEEGAEQFAQVPVCQSIAIWDGMLKPKMIGFIRYWQDDDSNTIVKAYDDIGMQGYVRKNGTMDFIIDGLYVEHGYGRVPVTRYTIDPDGRNIFDHCTALIDAFDKIISENYANDLQSLSSAILLLAGKLDTNAANSEDGISDAEKVTNNRLKYLDGLTLDGTGNVTDKVAYLTKNLDPTFPGSAAAIIERLIYEMLQLFNPNDEAFATPSGVAAKYKLIAFEYLCTTITTYFMRGLQDRIRLIKRINYAFTGEEQNTDVQIDWKRNLPEDMKEIADIAVALDGILSQETILHQFPKYVVPDVEEEIKRLNKEKEERMKNAVSLFPPKVPGAAENEGENTEEGNGEEIGNAKS